MLTNDFKVPKHSISEFISYYTKSLKFMKWELGNKAKKKIYIFISITKQFLNISPRTFLII